MIPAPDLHADWKSWVNAFTASHSEEPLRAIQLAAFAVAKLPPAGAFRACLIFVSDETGGAVPAFSDGTNWRRVTDRAVVS